VVDRNVGQMCVHGHDSFAQLCMDMIRLHSSLISPLKCAKVSTRGLKTPLNTEAASS
jgi:hypothetical protein